MADAIKALALNVDVNRPYALALPHVVDPNPRTVPTRVHEAFAIVPVLVTNGPPLSPEQKDFPATPPAQNVPTGREPSPAEMSEELHVEEETTGISTKRRSNEGAFAGVKP